MGLVEGATAEEVGAAILDAALQSIQNARAAQYFAGILAGRGGFTPELERGADWAARHLIVEAGKRGWLPGDVHQAALRRVDEFAVGYLVDTLAVYVREFAPESVDPIWLAQLEEMGATVWWSADEPHLGQWAGKQLLIPVEAMTTVIEALALLSHLPQLAVIRPLPGSARPVSGPRHAIDEKVLGRVRGLLAKAESTDFPDEAETLSAKAQELMTKYAIDRVLVEADTSAPDLPGARRIWLETPYLDAKALLVDAVAKANRCRAIFSSAWGFVAIVGDEDELDAVELLVTSLLVQATRAMIAHGNESGRDNHARSRTFRKSFLVSYATRIGERLTRANEETIAKSAAPERLLPVLASHQVAVDKAFETLFPTARTSRVSVGSAEGWHAGREAADRAQLAARRPIRK
ncbi:DUF2786 domain-containing protein [Nocardia sp. CDC160]|uniref:DUF2786 domain-containing protein n=1 Tax=Nocardia sp. CDC160 TaxID=3112166 RepID=UPI002DC04F98|nr:DUF2786 domain-containing protein [Nocardia sp. CDC160]MEC3917487.1 DUF2786 domain-containing protein [Nocardia sp. CDC160]